MGKAMPVGCYNIMFWMLLPMSISGGGGGGGGTLGVL